MTASFTSLKHEQPIQLPLPALRQRRSYQPGFVTIEQDDTLQTTALQIHDCRIVAIYVMRNPDKLRHLGGHAIH